ncbi:MAG: YihA family ribosome biogenesis GTP-binding protein [Deltaproteobacteria bacterium]|nr:YihA family ribosome biogenesis GTP-binding protein [Deltaproteobacteria bacterium]MBW2223658.1 YihA family ribosome biogenesis GTP-binding protein [Deltaproteobacteria bacterium]MBW2402644.1 YihA family ribosome biogenesis GTP-binding protein [Deltaproteobacteria bacterium]MBW2546976.1 YihA family ribosome biogenesis GTP-binding protein [Deltaproteobacteria bacterium]MBW2717627.1 YihA family ribosome biogenesis GTP-binding protein [Deltaproteobacteria bacterium]
MNVLDAEFVAGATVLGQLPAPTFAEVAFAGRSNVGKSSLINNLVQRKKLVRTSSAPGCTRAINIFRVRLRTRDEQADEAHLDLVDLPGYGYAQRSKAERKSWGPLIEGFLSERAGLRGAVVIVDIRRGVQDDDLQLLEFLESVDVTPILVATKLDKLASSKRKPAIAALKRDIKRPVIAYSAVLGDGRDALWKRILSVSGIERTERAVQP